MADASVGRPRPSRRAKAADAAVCRVDRVRSHAPAVADSARVDERGVRVATAPMERVRIGLVVPGVTVPETDRSSGEERGQSSKNRYARSLLEVALGMVHPHHQQQSVSSSSGRRAAEPTRPAIRGSGPGSLPSVFRARRAPFSAASPDRSMIGPLTAASAPPAAGQRQPRRPPRPGVPCRRPRSHRPRRTRHPRPGPAVVRRCPRRFGSWPSPRPRSVRAFAGRLASAPSPPTPATGSEDSSTSRSTLSPEPVRRRSRWGLGSAPDQSPGRVFRTGSVPRSASVIAQPEPRDPIP